MDNKFYVSYEAARLLKEKGYKEDVSRYYDEDGFLHFLEYDENYNYFQMSNNDLDLDHYAAPTKAEAIDWLESKGIIVELNYDDRTHMDNARWEYFIYTHDKDGWLKAMVCSRTKNNYYKIRLEAEEAAIIKALELL